jgi:Ion channel
MLSWLELAAGLLIWCGVLWDGFATIILPRTVAPMRRVSGRFYKWSWGLWATVGHRIGRRELRLSFLAVYGPLSILILLVVWAGLMIFGFTLIYHALGPRFQAAGGSVGFGTLLYMSASTFLTLGLGDVTSSDPIARLFVQLEAGSGYMFLALMITYMPVLEQAYGAREVGNVLIDSRAGHPPSAIRLLRRYAGSDRSEVLRSNLHEAERWMAEMLQSHLSHPVLSFYRAQHWGQSWLISLTTVLDACALLIVGGNGLPAAQARITYRMGLRLLKDLTEALSLTADPECESRLTEADLPVLRSGLKVMLPTLTLGPKASERLLRLVRRYDIYLFALSDWLVIPLPSWTSTIDDARASESDEEQ